MGWKGMACVAPRCFYQDLALAHQSPMLPEEPSSTALNYVTKL